MKIIFSRKGFDASAGGVPSPILMPSQDLWSIPIPEPAGRRASRTQYKDIIRQTPSGTLSLGDIVGDLTSDKNKKYTGDSYAHFDPDLDIGSLKKRPSGWRALFGQGFIPAYGQLRNEEVGPGDLFLFFGLFRQVGRNGAYHYVKGSTNCHVLFGWLQVKSTLSPDDALTQLLWASHFPHCLTCLHKSEEFIYLSKNTLSLDGLTSTIAGAGIFPTYHSDLCLTCPGEQCGTWRLPSYFTPVGKRSSLSYHADRERWTLNNDHVLLKTVGRGQEFVLDANEYPKVEDWARNIIVQHSAPSAGSSQAAESPSALPPARPDPSELIVPGSD